MVAITLPGFLRGSGGESPLVLVAATIGLGLAAHLVGGGATVDCAPMLLASVVAVVTTLGAQRLVGSVHLGAPVAVGALGIGQFGMHLALRSHEAADPNAQSLLGLSCGLIVTHTVATALLAVLLLGAHQSAELAWHLLSRVLRRVAPLITLPLADAPMGWTPVPAACCGSGRNQQGRYGLPRPRRGPPAPVL